MSIKSKWVAKILNGEKTIEIRKRFPKDYRGWVYIYCTKEDDLCCIKRIDKDRYICGKDFDTRDFPQLASGYNGKGKVVARFWCDKVENVHCNSYGLETSEHWYRTTDKHERELLNECALNFEELDDYLCFGNGYAVHISKLEIFDKPKELHEFMPIKWNKCNVKDKNGLYQCDRCPFGGNWWEHGGECRYGPLIKAPQSFCYIEID